MQNIQGFLPTSRNGGFYFYFFNNKKHIPNQTGKITIW